jgi:RNA polymerase sigma factor (sigma-70 family)
MTEQENVVDLTVHSPTSTQTRESTAALLRAADDNHPLAWEELVRRYNRLVRSTVASFRLQEADAEDIVQNTWLRVMERMDTIRDPERLGGWLATTASRECLALIRRRQREVPDDVAGKQLIEAKAPDVTVGPGEVQRAVDSAVGELSERLQALIQLLFYQPDCSYAEVSRATGMPPGSIGPTRSRVLRELRSTLAQRGFGPRSGACVGARLDESSLMPAPDVAEDVEREPPEGDRTGSYLLDDLLDKAEQVLREKLEPTTIGIDSSQGTGDEQLDELLDRADAALRERLSLRERRSHGKKLRPARLA